MIWDDSIFNYWQFMVGGRLKAAVGADSGTGSYSYSNTGVNTGDITVHFEEGSNTVHLVFTSTTAGTVTSGNDDFQVNWRLIPIPELTTLYFPDYADGGGWSVQLALSHTAAPAAEDTEVLVIAYDRGGQPIREFFGTRDVIEGKNVSTHTPDSFKLPPLGTQVLQSLHTLGLFTNPDSEPPGFRRGWIEVTTDTATVSGLLTYKNAETGVEVSVEPVELGNHFALFVEESIDVGTGLAIFKPDPSSRIEFRIYDEAGVNPLGEEFATHPVDGRTFQQAALTIPQWFARDGIDTEFLSEWRNNPAENFRGLLFLQAEDGASFAPIGIRFGKRKGSLSAVPVIRITEGGATAP